MNSIQLNTLELSIAHWDRVCMGIEASNADKGCECCKVFDGCRECPIAAVYYNNCSGLGYHSYAKLHLVEETIPENRNNSTVAYKYWLGIEAAEAILNNLLWILPTNHPWRVQATNPAESYGIKPRMRNFKGI